MLAESAFKRNYCHACPTRFTVFPLPSCCVSVLLWEYRRTGTDDKYKTTVDVFFLSLPRFVHTLFHQTKELTTNRLQTARLD